MRIILTWVCRHCGWANDNNNGPCRKCGRDEARLSELAAYHVGLFTGAVADHDAGLDYVAHALWLLAREAERRREQWLTSAKASN